jgi:hypothetical protein
MMKVRSVGTSLVGIGSAFVLGLLGLNGCQVSAPLLGKGGTTTTTNGITNGTTNEVTPGKAARGGSKASTDAWFDAMSQQGSQVARLMWLSNHHPKEGDTAPDQRADRALALLKENKFAELDKACAAGTFEGADAAVVDGETLDPKSVCPMMSKRDDLMKTSVREWATAYGEKFVVDMTRRLDDIKSKKKVALSSAVEGVDAAGKRKYVTSFVSKYFDALGEPVPDALLKKVDDYVAAFHATVESVATNAPTSKPAASDAGAEAAVRKAYERTSGIQIQKVWMTKSEWQPVKNDIGIILRRYKDAAVLVKGKTGNYCLVVPASVGQQYQGGGTYASNYGVDTFLEGEVVKCP